MESRVFMPGHGEVPRFDVDTAPPERRYEPLREEPKLFQKFAELGDAAIRVAKKRGADAALDTKDDATVQAAALAFVRDYGPPVIESRGFLRVALAHPNVFLLELAPVLHAAAEVALAVHYAKRAQDGLATEEELAWLEFVASHHLQGVHLRLRGGQSHLTADHAVRDLLSAMWLQLWEHVTRGCTWRPCSGCGLIFVQDDPRQEYHDRGCRNRANVRRTRERQREAAGTAHEEEPYAQGE